MSRISNEKAYRVAKQLAAPLSEKSDKYYESFIELVNETYRKQLPKEILDFQGKYPKTVRTESLYIRNCYIQLKYPYYKEAFDKTIGNTREFEEMYNKWRQLEKEYKEFYNKIQCTLTKLGTYKRIKEEFPEAYEILVGMDKITSKGSSICDDVEGLRVQLSQISK